MPGIADKREQGASARGRTDPPRGLFQVTPKARQRYKTLTFARGQVYCKRFMDGAVRNTSRLCPVRGDVQNGGVPWQRYDSTRPTHLCCGPGHIPTLLSYAPCTADRGEWQQKRSVPAALAAPRSEAVMFFFRPRPCRVNRWRRLLPDRRNCQVLLRTRPTCPQFAQKLPVP